MFSPIKHEFGNRGGFTLLETVVAIALILAATIGPVALASRAIFSAKFSRSKLIALNLAQEGQELIRHMRDNNVLAGFDWRLSSGSCATCTRLDDGSYQPDVYTQANGGTPPANTSSPLLYDATTGLYSQSLGSASPFTRVVDISTPGADQMRVLTTVTWTESGLSRQVRLEEVAYNWR